MPAPVDPYDFQNLITIIDAKLVNARFKRLFDALDKTKIGLDANSFKDGAFTAVKFTHPAWQTVALGGVVWTPANLSFYKDAMGTVRLRPEGFATNVNLANGTTVATMPVGFRPGTLQYINLWLLRQTPMWGSVDVDGTVKFVGGGPATGGALTPGSAGTPIVFNGAYKAEG